MIYNKFSSYLKDKYKTKVYKLPIKLAGTCPNRDGRIGFGGCAFCGEEGGSFENLDERLSVKDQVSLNKEYISKKYHAEKFIAYFQNYTNTYMDFDSFKQAIEDSIIPGVVAIYISTRPDCIQDEQLDFLMGVKEKYKVNILFELGMQTANYKILDKMNRGHSLAEMINAVIRIKDHGFQVCTHVIIGLPGEEMIDVIETAKIISALRVDQVKIHALYLLKDTLYGKMYLRKELKVISLDEYIDRVIMFLRYLDPSIVIQRLVGRSDEDASLFSNWDTSWWKIQDMILNKMGEAGFKQGDCFNYLQALVKSRKEDIMIKFILGPSGSGKTKLMVDKANEEKEAGNGNFIFIDTDDSQVFSLDHDVRLINAKNFNITSVEEFYGFISGIISMDFDIEKIYIDGIYEILDLDEDNLALLIEKLENISENNKLNIVLGLNKEIDALPEKYAEEAVELEV